MKLLYISRIDNSVMLKEFAEEFRHAGFEFVFSHIHENDILKDYEKIDPDIVFVHHNKGILSKNLWEQIKCFKIWWSNDDRFPPDAWRVHFAPIFDLFIVASTNSVGAMKKLGTDAEYLIMGYNKKANENRVRDIDLAFLGQNSENIFTHSLFRKNTCLRLKEELSEFRLHGLGWGSDVKKEGRNLYHRVKIGLSISHENYDLVYSNRILHIMGAGAMCLCFRTSNLESIFKENEMCVYFNTYDELIEKYRYYIKHDSERERIAKAGRNFVENNFTWRHKAQPIIEMIKKRL